MLNKVVKFEKEDLGFKTPNNLLSLGEIEKKYKIKYNTAYKYVVLEHKIPYYRLGRNIRVSEIDFLSLFEYMGVK